MGPLLEGAGNIPQQSFVQWNDPHGNKLISINRDGTISCLGLNVPISVPQGDVVFAYRATVKVSSSQLLASYTAPVLLVSCPIGLDIVVKGINVYFVPGPTNTPYTFSNPNTSLLIGYDTAPPSQSTIYDGDYYQMEAAGFVDQTLVNAQPIWVPVEGFGSFQTPGGDLYLTEDTSALTGGDGTLLVYIDYSLTPQP